MRITIATGPFYPTPPAPTGAVQRIWTDLGLEFARRGHDVNIIACTYAGQPRSETIGGVHVRRRTGLRQGKKIYLDIVKDAWYSANAAMMLPAADVVVSNAFWLPVFARLRSRSRGRLVVHIARVPKGQLRLYTNAAIIDTVSETIGADIVREAPWAAGRVRVNPNPIDLDAFKPRETPAGQNRSGTSARTLAYTGRIHPEKGVHLLVEAYTRVRTSTPDLELRLIGAHKVNEGGGGEDYLRRLRSLSDGHAIRIDDPIYDRNALASALQQADLYCYPSLAEKGESFGVAPLEAMATGLAPLVSNLACFRQFLTPGRDGFVFDHRVADQVGSLSAALTDMLSDWPRTLRMGQDAATRARDFSIAAIAERHLKDFEEILAKP